MAQRDTYGHTLSATLTSWRAFQERNRAILATAAKVYGQFQGPPSPDKVSCQRVTFFSDGVRLVGMLWRPPLSAAAGGASTPGIVLCHGWGGLRAHLDIRYASKFAAQGYVCLTFDYRGWGDSDGALVMHSDEGAAQDGARAQDMAEQNPQSGVFRARVVRQTVDMQWQLQDIDAAVSFLHSEPGVGPIGLWGTSQAGGHVIQHAALDDRVVAVVSQVPSMGRRGAGDVGRALRESSRLVAAQAARTGYVPAGAREHHLPAMDGAPVQRRAFCYDPMLSAVAVKVPVLVIDVEHEELWSREENGRAAFDVIRRSVPGARYELVKGMNHYDAYDKGSEVTRKLALAFFDQTLRATSKL